MKSGRKRILPAQRTADNAAFGNEDIWAAIDGLAKDNGLTPSRLAINSGHDASLFNLCRRRRRDGGFRSLSLEVISDVLRVTGETSEEFARRVSRIVRKRASA